MKISLKFSPKSRENSIHITLKMKLKRDHHHLLFSCKFPSWVIGKLDLRRERLAIVCDCGRIMKTKYKTGARERLHVITKSCYNQCQWHHRDPLTCAFLAFTLFSEFLLKYWTNWNQRRRPRKSPQTKRHHNNQYNWNPYLQL